METKRIRKTVYENIYVADDGREFDDPDDCEAYEMRLLSSKIGPYSGKFEKTYLDECTYVIADTEERLDIFVKCLAYEGISSKGVTDKPGIYMYSDGMWVNITEAIDKLKSLHI